MDESAYPHQLLDARSTTDDLISWVLKTLPPHLDPAGTTKKAMGVLSNDTEKLFATRVSMSTTGSATTVQVKGGDDGDDGGNDDNCGSRRMMMVR